MLPSVLRPKQTGGLALGQIPAKDLVKILKKSFGTDKNRVVLFQNLGEDQKIRSLLEFKPVFVLK